MADAAERRELLERFRSGPGNLERSIDGLSESEIEFRPGPGKWSIREIVIHLCDSEIVCAHRVRAILGDDEPFLVSYDQDNWAGRLNYSKRNLSQSVDLFRLLRKTTAELFRDLEEDAWDRYGNHQDKGKVSLVEVVKLYAEHCENHVAQIRKIRLQLSQQQ